MKIIPKIKSSIPILTILAIAGCSTTHQAEKTPKPSTPQPNYVTQHSYKPTPNIFQIQSMNAEANNWIKTLPENYADYGSYPKNHEEIVKSHLSRILKDPHSAKISKISKPRKEHKITDKFEKKAIYGYSTCAWINAKNSYGGYTGEKLHWFLITNGYVHTYSIGAGEIYIGRSKNCKDG